MKKILLLLSILFIVFSCSSKEEIINSKILIYAPKAPPSIPLALAAENNSSIEIKYYTDVISEVLPSVIKNEPALYILPTNVSAKFYNKNKNMIQLAVSSMGLVHILTQDDNITSFNDLDKTNISVPAPGSSPDVISSYLFKKQNISPIIKFGSTPEIAKLFIADKIKTAVLPEPMASLALFKNKKARRLTDTSSMWVKLTDNSTGIPQVGICGSKDYISLREKDINAFLNLYKEALENINSDMGLAANIGKNIMKLPIPPTVITSSVPSMNLVFLTGDDAYKELEIYFKALMDINPQSIGGKIPDKDFIYRSF